MADLVMGLPNNLWVRYTINGGDATSPDYNILFPSWGMYVNDKFRLSPKLTVSAGLRYELSIPDYTPNPSAAPCCAIYTATPDGGILEYPGIASGLPVHYLSTPKLDFAPRISIAYSFNPHRVVRAGYGIFYDTGASQISNNVGNAIYGTSAAVNYNVNNVTLGAPPDTPVLNLSNIFPSPQATTLGSFPVSTGKGQGYQGDGQLAGITYYDQKSEPLPYYRAHDARCTATGRRRMTSSPFRMRGRRVARDKTKRTSTCPLTKPGGPLAAVLGIRRLTRRDRIMLGRFGDIYVIRPNLNSFYNALIVQYRHDFNKGFQFMSNYTWGKTVSDYPWVEYPGG